MKQTFQIINVKCEGCASTLKEKLFEQFGEIDVNLEVQPREITLHIEEDKIADLAIELKKLGYPLASEDMGFVDSTSAKAKSFVSCAIGKMNT
jgi:copper chaperone CopZ